MSFKFPLVDYEDDSDEDAEGNESIEDATAVTTVNSTVESIHIVNSSKYNPIDIATTTTTTITTNTSSSTLEALLLESPKSTVVLLNTSDLATNENASPTNSIEPANKRARLSNS